MKPLLVTTLMVIAIGIVLNACVPGETVVPTKSPGTVAAPAKGSVVGWEAEWEKVVAAAKDEGRVSVYTQWGPTERAGLVEAFRARFGIDVEFTTAGTGSELTAKMVKERRAGIFLADVVGQGATTLLIDMNPEGILAPIEPMLILPEVKEPNNWTGGQLFLDRGKLAIAFSAEYTSFVGRNTDLVKGGEIKSYYDLLDPKLKGKIVMRDPMTPGSSNAWISFMERIWGLEKTKDYLRQLVKQEPVVTRDLRLQGEWLAKGKYAVSAAPHQPTLLGFQDVGAPVALVRVTEGALITASGSCLALPAGQLPHPNAAKVFINWLLSREGQSLFARWIFRPSARVDVPPPEGYQGIVRLPGEQIVVEDEDNILGKGRLIDIAKEIFTPLR
ncbi:MAG: extracellular solute-binding protein [Chloroflexi bacterium]|nr:extracellular solute-binding protein [Chloroflexota bacterium]